MSRTLKDMDREVRRRRRSALVRRERARRLSLRQLGWVPLSRSRRCLRVLLTHLLEALS